MTGIRKIKKLELQKGQSHKMMNQIVELVLFAYLALFALEDVWPLWFLQPEGGPASTEVTGPWKQTSCTWVD